MKTYNEIIARTGGDWMPHDATYEDFYLTDKRVITFYQMTNSKNHSNLVGENRRVAWSSAAMVANLVALAIYVEGLCVTAPQPVGSSLLEAVILSGYRYRVLNSAVGGSEYSQHMSAMAVDFYCPYLFEAFVRAILDPAFEFHQLIFYSDRNFIHYGLPTGTNDGEVIVKGRDCNLHVDRARAIESLASGVAQGGFFIDGIFAEVPQNKKNRREA